MTFNAVQPMFREIVAESVVPQSSLGRRDRELQLEEGRPPMEVSAAEQEALCWQKNEDLREKWRKRRYLPNTKHRAASDENQVTPDETQESSATQSETMQENMESREAEEAGTLFDGRL